MNQERKKKLQGYLGPIYDFYRWGKNQKTKHTSPKKLSEKLYRRRFGRNIDWAHPRELNEKIRWMLLNTDTSMWTLLADKYKVREVVRQKGYGGILVPLYGVWEKASDIDFSQLPDSFVMKTNHGSGHVFTVLDKSKADLESIRKDLADFLKEPFGWKAAELQYYNIPRRIIAEKVLPNDKPFSSSIVDYKFYCFNGEPFLCGVFYDRGKHKNASFYDMDWHRHDEWRTPSLADVPQKEIPRPETFEQMRKACKGLAAEFPFVRMDFYEAEGKLYFGEYTFTPAALGGGSLSLEILEKMGDLLELPEPSKAKGK